MSMITGFAMMMLLVMGGIIFLVVWGIGQTAGNASRGDRPSGTRALEILEERFARGEIDRQEFESRRNDLRR
jgi:putative membrane protein